VNILLNFDVNYANDDYSYDDDYESDYNSSDHYSNDNKFVNKSLDLVNINNNNITDDKVLNQTNLTLYKNDTNFGDLEKDNDLNHESDNEYNDNDSQEDKSSSIINEFFDTLANHEGGHNGDHDGDHEDDNEKKFKFNNQTKGVNFNRELVIEKIFGLFEKLMSSIKPVHKQTSQRLSELLFASHLSPKCLAAFARINNAINEKKLWAFKCMY